MTGVKEINPNTDRTLNRDPETGNVSGKTPSEY